jgi:hypothetical protein
VSDPDLGRYRVRREGLPDDALVVVRGGLLELLGLRSDALAAERRFGIAGLSVFAAPDEAALEALATERLARFDVLTLVTMGELRLHGLEVVPTFRHPHYTIILRDIDADLRRLLECENVLRINRHRGATEP